MSPVTKSREREGEGYGQHLSSHLSSLLNMLRHHTGLEKQQSFVLDTVVRVIAKKVVHPARMLSFLGLCFLGLHKCICLSGPDNIRLPSGLTKHCTSIKKPRDISFDAERL